MSCKQALAVSSSDISVPSRVSCSSTSPFNLSISLFTVCRRFFNSGSSFSWSCTMDCLRDMTMKSKHTLKVWHLLKTCMYNNVSFWHLVIKVYKHIWRHIFKYLSQNYERRVLESCRTYTRVIIIYNCRTQQNYYSTLLIVKRCQSQPQKTKPNQTKINLKGIWADGGGAGKNKQTLKPPQFSRFILWKTTFSSVSVIEMAVNILIYKPIVNLLLSDKVEFM